MIFFPSKYLRDNQEENCNDEAIYDQKMHLKILFWDDIQFV